MADTSSNWENLSIYYANLSLVYISSCLFTLLALFSTWWFRKIDKCKDASDHLAKSVSHRSKIKSAPQRREGFDSEERQADDDSETLTEAKRLVAERFTNEHSLMRHVKSARQSAIERQLTAGLSEEQLQKERETQATQLAAIYELLKEKEDQFKITSMDELQEQLRLYRS